LLLKDAGIDYEFGETKTLNDACILSAEANRKGYDAVVAVGGDGTINGVINGFYDQAGRRVSKAKFGVIYTGTSPDFCKSYGIPLKPDRAVARLANPHVISIPIGKITLREGLLSGPDPAEDHEMIKYFGCCANIGLGAALARRANGGIRRVFGDFAGTFVSLLLTLAKFRPSDFPCIIDGREETIATMYNMSVGLTPYIASGIKLSREVAGKNGAFYLMTVRNLKLSQVIPLLKKVYSGNAFENCNYLTISWCREIMCEMNDRNPEVEFDGDPAGYLPCRIEMAKDKLDLIV
jgi:diacylglycerol kinase family enzyme